MTALFTLSSSFPVLAIVGKNEQFIADQLLGNRALCPKCAASKLFYKVPESNSEITSCLSINRQISQKKKTCTGNEFERFSKNLYSGVHRETGWTER